MRLTVVGSGDAFGSGGRNNTCFLIESAGVMVALDFGATSLVALKRLGLDPNRIEAVMLSHLHGDHFGGLPFMLLDAQFDSRRERPLTVIGPPGTATRLETAIEVFFPGSSRKEWRFPFSVVDLPCAQPYRFGEFTIETHEVIHPSGAPATGVRIGDGQRLLAYSGDTNWTETLFEVARGADLFICECYRFSGAPVNHLAFEMIEAHRESLGAARIMLTHMSPEMLAHVPEVEAMGYLAADDGFSTEV